MRGVPGPRPPGGVGSARLIAVPGGPAGAGNGRLPGFGEGIGDGAGDGIGEGLKLAKGGGMLDVEVARGREVGRPRSSLRFESFVGGG